MCLITDEKKKFKVAKKDIVCYKAVEFVKNGNMFKTFYWFGTIPFECIDGKEPYKAKGSIKNGTRIVNGKASYGLGLIHTFAEENLEQFRRCFKQRSIRIYECVIPKGTKYIDGVDEGRTACYGSCKIVFKRLTYYTDNRGVWHNNCI